MFELYWIFAIVNIGIVCNIIKSIRTKKRIDKLSVILFLSFNIFFIFAVIFGGSAFKDSILIECLFIAAVSIAMIIEIIKMIKAKKYLDMLCMLFIIPFGVFFLSVMILGGSAFHDAANHYSLYQPGHYYLVSHGNYTEVSYGQFQYMKIIEVIGLASFGIAFLLGFVRAFHVDED